MSLSEVIECRHCGNISKMTILGIVDDLENDDSNYGGGYDYGTKYEVLKCPNPKCRKVNIGSYSYHDAFHDEDWPYVLIYPQKSNSPIGLPVNISKALRAAEKVKTIDVNAYAMLIRRLLELVCIDRSATGANLATMLKDLSDKKEIPEKLVSVARGLKDFGNIGAHAGSGDLTSKEVPIVTALCNAILEYVYSAPYLATLAENSLKTIKVKKAK